MAIRNVGVTTSAQSLLDAVPDGTNYAVTVAMFCNTSSPNPADEDADLNYLYIHIINNGNSGQISNNNMVVNKVPIRAGETFTLDTEKVILEPNDTFVAYSETGITENISAMVSYVEI